MNKIIISCATAVVLLLSFSGAANAAGINAVLAAQDARITQLEATVSKLVQVAKQQQQQGSKKVWLSPMAVQVASFQIEGIGTGVVSVTHPLPMPDYAEVNPYNFFGTVAFFNDGTYTMSANAPGSLLQMQADIYGQPEYFSGQRQNNPITDNGTYVMAGRTVTLTSALDGSVIIAHLAPDFSMFTGSSTTQDVIPGAVGYSTEIFVGIRIN